MLVRIGNATMSRRTKNEPVFMTLFRKVERDILQGKLKYGELLPSDQDLADQYNVSRYTAREVYSELVRRHLVQRVRRKGTQVIYDPANTRIRKVGLILVADVPAYYLFQKGVEQVLGDRGAGIFIQYSYDDEAKNEAAIQEALDHGVEALITAPPTVGSYETYKRLVSEGFPLVLALAFNPELHCVYPDDYTAGSLMGHHFGKQGFQHPVVVSDDQSYGRERLYGFREGLAHHGLRLADDRVFNVEYLDKDGTYIDRLGLAEVETVLAMQPQADAVFAVNDSTAIAMHYWFNRKGLRIPGDLAIAGVDHLGNKFHPFQLSSVDIGLEQMGRTAAETVLHLLSNRPDELMQQQVKPELVVSDSTQVE